MTDIAKLDLETEEVKATSTVLLAGARHFGQYCQSVRETYMRCKYETKDPARCVDEGKEVTKCGVEFFRKLKMNCNDEFTAHWQCLDRINDQPHLCRKTQQKYDECVLNGLGLDGDYERFLVSHEKDRILE